MVEGGESDGSEPAVAGPVATAGSRGGEVAGAGVAARAAVAAAEEPAGASVTLSLISHTNVGKTTLARTLLRQDVGETFDQAHVTDTNTSYTLVEAGGAMLRLWDTPGFGDTARLVHRLRSSGRPIVWFLAQAWDRLADRPLWCSQQAVKNARDDSDVVLYLVNASEDPRAAAYVDLEMEVLEWIGKPVVVLVNQTGGGRAGELERSDVERWARHFGEGGPVRKVIPLDAFARCWVQESVLLGVVAEVLEPPASEVFPELRAAWEERNLEVFGRSVELLAARLVASLADSEGVPPETLVQKLGVRRRERDLALKAARHRLAERLSGGVRATLTALIELHGLEGEAAERAAGAAGDSFEEPHEVNESIWSAVGGVATGALTGLVVDLKAGGMTFGGGAVAGGLLGGASAYGLAKGYNLARGVDNRVRWSLDHFVGQVEALAVGYLAVAHFGRGRGAWEEGEPPEAWIAAVRSAVRSARPGLEDCWKAAKDSTENGGAPDTPPELRRAIGRCLRQVLTELYPEATPGW